MNVVTDSFSVNVTVAVCAVDAVTGFGDAENFVKLGAVASRVTVAWAVPGAVSVLFDESTATV